MVTLVPQKFASQSSPLVGEDHERRLSGFAGREAWAAQMEEGTMAGRHHPTREPMVPGKRGSAPSSVILTKVRIQSHDRAVRYSGS